jgi:hypothetical protein
MCWGVYALGKYCVVELWSDARRIDETVRGGGAGGQEVEVWEEKKVHRYCRLVRFKKTLDELIGMRGKVKVEVVEGCEELVFDEWNLWDVIRGYLKKQKLGTFF